MTLEELLEKQRECSTHEICNMCEYDCDYCTPSLIEEEIKKLKSQQMQDSGERMQFETGALREPHDGKGRFDLISPYMLMRLAKWYELGAKKYGSRNWEKGIPPENCLNSAFRHMTKYMMGMEDEDHLAAIIWNIAAIIHFEECDK